MNTIETAVSMMQGMTEADQERVLDYIKLIYSASTASSPFVLLSGDELIERLAAGRTQNEAGEGIPFEEGMKKIGVRNGFV